MNLHYLLQRLRGRATCVKARGARLEFSARVINVRGDNHAISLGANSVVKGELLVFAHGGRIDIGEWSFVGEGTRIWSGLSISIGDRVMIAHNVNIFDNQTHPIDPVARHRHFREILESGHPRNIDLGDQPVRIDDDAWIAAGATILKGIRVGRGAIVAAGAVVTRDVPDGALVAGNPARIVRHAVADVAGSDASRHAPSSPKTS